MTKDKFLKMVYQQISENPDWYGDTIGTINLAWTKFKKGLDAQINYTHLALAGISPKEARKLQKTINRDMWPKVLQEIIDIRANGKTLSNPS